jgi:hypothetical protein
LKFDMLTIAEIRRANLELLVAQAGTLDAVAAAGGTTSIYLSQIRNRALDQKTKRAREMGSAMARRLEDGMKKPMGWMDQHHAIDGVTKIRVGQPSAEADPRELLSGLSTLLAQVPRDERQYLATQLSLWVLQGGPADMLPP